MGNSDNTLKNSSTTSDHQTDLQENDATWAKKKGIWPVGTRLINGMYEVLPLSETSSYAEGGVGIVQRVRHRDWDMELAVKSPKPGTLNSESGKQNFERECHTWIDLGLHPNIVNCYLVRRIDDIPRLFAEFVPDGSLRDWIRDGRLYEGGGNTALARILDVGIQFAWGLDYAHSQGLLHLDVKPGNVMMAGNTKEVTAKVTDFGLAKTFGSEGGGEFCEGMTPAFCSPEQYESFQLFRKQAEGRQIDADENVYPITKQSDIWSWAISLISMFFGRAPCKRGGQTAAEVFEAFLRHEPNEKYPPFPPQLIDIIRRCFRKNQLERPESMQFVADRLVRVYEECVGYSYRRHKPRVMVRTPEVISNHGASLLDLNKPDKALELFNQALAVNKWQPQILFNKLMTEWRYGRITDLEIESGLEEALRVNSTDANAFYVCGLFLREHGNVKMSRTFLEKAYELEPNRDDIANAFRLSIRQLKQEVRRIGKFRLQNRSEDETLPLFINKQQNFLLINPEARKYTLLDIASGEVAAFFSDNPEAANTSLDLDSTPLAVSDDKQWQLNSEFDGRLTLYDLNEKKNAEKVQKETANGKKDKKNLFKLQSRDTFEMLPWGQSRRCSDFGHKYMFLAKGHHISMTDLKTGILLGNFFGCDTDIIALTVSSDGLWLVSASADNSVRLWDTQTRRCLRTLQKPKKASAPLPKIKGLWIDDQHRYVFVLYQSNMVEYWTIDLICNDPKVRAPLQICFMVQSEELEQRFDSMTDLVKQGIELYNRKDNAASLEVLNKLRSFSEWRMFSQEPEINDWLRQLKRHTYRSSIQQVFVLNSFNIQTPNTTAWAGSFDGRFAVSGGQDHILRVWDFQPDQNVGTDSTGLVKNTSSTARIQYQIGELKGHRDWIKTIDITNNGHYAVTGSWDQTIRIWDLFAGSEIKILSDGNRDLTNVKFAPDGRTLACSTGEGHLFLIDGANGKLIGNLDFAHNGRINALGFCRDGRYLITGGEDRSLKIFQSFLGKVVRTYKDLPDEVTAVVLTANLRWCLCGLANGKICAFNLMTNSKDPEFVFEDHMAQITSMILLPEEDKLVTGSKDGTVRFWNLSEQKLVHTINNVGPISGMSLDFFGNYLSVVTQDSIVRRWELIWNYTFPGPYHSRNEAEEMLAILIGYYRFFEDIYQHKKSPIEYFQEKTLQKYREHHGGKIEVSEEVLQNALTEFELRGYGVRTSDEIYDMVNDVLNSCPYLRKINTDIN